MELSSIWNNLNSSISEKDTNKEQCSLTHLCLWLRRQNFLREVHCLDNVFSRSSVATVNNAFCDPVKSAKDTFLFQFHAIETTVLHCYRFFHFFFLI